MTGFLLRALISAIGLWLASVWVAGVRIHGPGTLLLAAVLLGVVNAVVRPIAFILTLPLTILTLGLFLLVLNAAMVVLVAALLPGFHLAGFRAALLTAIIVWLTGWVGSALIGHRGIERYARR
ncbi:MAG TPA: phage holin family protein [Steroidobacteraceae bacterium]|jgi:putative membrane protein|nr:phage holin family protein [Steroidobacteraceae bacterium]